MAVKSGGTQIGIIMAIISLTVWLTGLGLRVEASVESLKKVEKKQEMLELIQSDLNLIKYKLTEIDKKLNK